MYAIVTGAARGKWKVNTISFSGGSADDGGRTEHDGEYVVNYEPSPRIDSADGRSRQRVGRSLAESAATGTRPCLRIKDSDKK